MQDYDLYISIGLVCRPAYHLQQNDLRLYTMPLDWQKTNSLDTVIHLFKTKFVDFFAEIEEINKDAEGANRWIEDTKNGILSIHHFPKDKEIEKVKKKFVQKMKKRFNRLNDDLAKSKRIVLVGNREEEIDKIESFLIVFSELYPHLEIKLLNVRHSDELDLNSFRKQEFKISEKLTIDEYTINDRLSLVEQEDWRGNIKMWETILRNY